MGRSPQTRKVRRDRSVSVWSVRASYLGRFPRSYAIAAAAGEKKLMAISLPQQAPLTQVVLPQEGFFMLVARQDDELS